MWDLMLIAATVLFFAIAVAYVYGCERLSRKHAGQDTTGPSGARP